MTIDEARAHIGGEVLWVPPGDSTEEAGRITSVSDRQVLVRFRGAAAGQPIDPADLTLLAEGDADVTERRRQWRASLRGDAD